MKQILIVEQDEQFAGNLFQALLRVDDFQISAAPTVRQACLIVGRQEQDLAFISLDGLEGTVEALRRLQPDLPLVVTLPRPGLTVPAPYVDKVQAVLSWSALVYGLPDLLARIWQEQVPEGRAEGADTAPVQMPAQGSGRSGYAEPRAVAGAVETVARQALAPLLQGTTLPETILTVLLSQGEHLLAHAGTFTADQAQLVAERVSESWVPGLSAQLQFLLLPSRTSDLQLYTRPTGSGLLLTVVARPETKMGALRRYAEQLAEQVAAVAGIEDLETFSAPPSIAVELRDLQAEQERDTGYALAWGSRDPLAEPLRIALRRVLERIAVENGCDLSYLDVQAQLVHMVVRCHPPRPSAWISHRFKRAAETAIQSQFGVEKQLWQKGYYAVESAEPLSAAELNLILGHSS